MEDIKIVTQVTVWKDVDWAAKLSLGAPSFKRVMYKMQMYKTKLTMY
jgi:hypothetical protein